MIFNVNNNGVMILDQMRPNGKIAVNIEVNNNPRDKDSHLVRMISPEEMVSLVNILHYARLNGMQVEYIETLVDEEITRLKDFYEKQYVEKTP